MNKRLANAIKSVLLGKPRKVAETENREPTNAEKNERWRMVKRGNRYYMESQGSD